MELKSKMVTRSKGPRNNTRKKLKKNVRNRGKISIKAFLQKFGKGEKVVIKPEPAHQKTIPHRRFFGKSAEVVESKKNTCVVQLSGKPGKKLVISPVHLKKQ